MQCILANRPMIAVDAWHQSEATGTWHIVMKVPRYTPIAGWFISGKKLGKTHLEMDELCATTIFGNHHIHVLHVIQWGGTFAMALRDFASSYVQRLYLSAHVVFRRCPILRIGTRTSFVRWSPRNYGRFMALKKDSIKNRQCLMEATCMLSKKECKFHQLWPALYWHAELRRFAMRCSWTEESEEGYIRTYKCLQLQYVVTFVSPLIL